MPLQQTFVPVLTRAAFLAFAFRESSDTIDTHMTRRGPTCDDDGWQEQGALRETARALGLRRDGDWPARGDKPAYAQYTVHDFTSPAMGASFCVPVAELTPATLRAAFALCVARFTAASLKNAPKTL